MTPEQIIEMAKQAVCYDKHDKLFWGDVGQIQAFAQLVRNAALEEAADSLYGNGLEMSLLQDLREEIRSMKS